MNEKAYNIIYYGLLIIFITLFSFVGAVIIDNTLSGNYDFFMNGNLTIQNIINGFFSNQKAQKLFFVIESLFVLIIFYLIFQRNSLKSNASPLREVATGIKTPIPVGEGQYGTATFMDKKNINKVYDLACLEKKENTIKNLLNNQSAETILDNAGLVINYKKKAGKEQISYIGSDVHTLTVGSTRSRKNKRIGSSDSRFNWIKWE